MAATSEKSRYDTGPGRTRNKLRAPRAPDPAMAVLGTDEEAAGTPGWPRDLEAARRQEIQPSGQGSDESHATWLTLAGVAAAIGIAVISAAVLH